MLELTWRVGCVQPRVTVLEGLEWGRISEGVKSTDHPSDGWG